MPTLHLVRGLPGSGKSTFARKLADQLHCKHLETDQYFTDADGNYSWDANKIAEAHEWCRQSAIDEILAQRDCVVSNTFIVPKHITCYLEDVDPFIDGFMGLLKFPVVIYEMTNQYGNVHGVPLNTMSKMMSHWTPNSELEKLTWRNPVTFKTIK